MKALNIFHFIPVCQPTFSYFIDIDSCLSEPKDAKSSSIVPIAVGCALAGLIIIVLIAYLIGRRKNDGRGYQQV